MLKLFCCFCSLFLIFSNIDARRRGRSAKKVYAHVNQHAHIADVKKEDFKSQNLSISNQIITAEYGVVMDCETGEILFDQKATDKCVPSSMTKLMTLYILFSELAAGRLKMTDEFQVSVRAQKQEGSRSFLQAGTFVKVEDLVRCIIVHSGNDACVVVAEGLCGDVSAFVMEMNEKAKEMGLQNSHFENPMGLPDNSHYSCVADIAVISRRLILDFPQYYHYFSEREFKINNISQFNRNRLLGNSMGIDGLKTGRTSAGGFGISVSASNNGHRLIAVVNGCKSSKDRAADANKLLAIGFREFMPYSVATAGHPVTTARVWLGEKPVINVCTNENINISIHKKYRDTLKVNVTLKDPLEAPIKLGDQVGTLTYSYANFVSKPYPIFAAEESNKLGWFDRAIFTIKALIFGSSSNNSSQKDSIPPMKVSLSAHQHMKDMH